MQKESAMRAEDPGSLSQPRSSLSHLFLSIPLWRSGTFRPPWSLHSDTWTDTTPQSKEMKCNRHKSIRGEIDTVRISGFLHRLSVSSLANLCASALSWRWEEPSHKGAFFAGTLMSSGPESNKCSQFTDVYRFFMFFHVSSFSFTKNPDRKMLEIFPRCIHT